MSSAGPRGRLGTVQFLDGRDWPGPGLASGGRGLGWMVAHSRAGLARLWDKIGSDWNRPAHLVELVAITRLKSCQLPHPSLPRATGNVKSV